MKSNKLKIIWSNKKKQPILYFIYFRESLLYAWQGIKLLKCLPYKNSRVSLLNNVAGWILFFMQEKSFWEQKLCCSTAPHLCGGSLQVWGPAGTYRLLESQWMLMGQQGDSWVSAATASLPQLCSQRSLLLPLRISTSHYIQPKYGMA